MKLENGIYEDELITNFLQTGNHHFVTNKSLLNILETIAGAHSAYCNITFSDLAKTNQAWVILEWKLKVIKRLVADEKIRVQTWGRYFNKIYVLRDFKIFNENNELVAIATSKWCLVDTKLGKISKMPENLDEIYHGFRDESVFGIDDLPKLNVPSDMEPVAEDTYKIRRFDIDLNNHVHNLNYLNYAYEVLPMDVYKGAEMNNIEIAYKREIKFGETIKSFLYDGLKSDTGDNSYTIVIKSDDESTLHSIVKLYN